MKKKAFWLFVFMLLVIFPVRSSALSLNPDQLVRIGLRYGSSATSTVNVFYEEGYDLGYIDGSDSFVNIYSIDNRYITVAKDSNFTFKSSTMTEGASGDGKLVGAYHCEVSEEFSDMDELFSELSRFRELGLNSAFPAYSAGRLVIRVGSYQSQNDAQGAAGEIERLTGFSVKAMGGGANTMTVVDMNSGDILFEYYDATNKALAIRPMEGTGGGNAQLKNASNYYLGAFEFLRQSDGNLTFINSLDVDSYLKGVVPYEMSSTWPKEALKAQAVAARNYVYANLKRHSSNGFCLCNGQHCQAYGGALRMAASSDTAVDETSGMVLTYNGSLAEVYYHSSSGGSTENVENVWYNAIPYIVAVPSIMEDLDKAHNGYWTYTLTGEELRDHFKSKGYDVATITSFYVDQFTNAGNVYRVVAVDKNGKKITLEKSNARAVLSPYANSQRFTISGGGGRWIFINRGTRVSASSPVHVRDGFGATTSCDVSKGRVLTANGEKEISMTEEKADGTFVIDGRGWGNNVGMSQWSARGMAEDGWTFDQILTYFFPGTEVSYFN